MTFQPSRKHLKAPKWLRLTDIASAPLHKRLGMETTTMRLPVLAHLERRRGKPPLYLYDPINRVYYGDHLYRASITLPNGWKSA